MLIIVSFVSFVVINLPPGDYMTTVQNRLANQSGMSQDQARAMAERMRSQYGLDQPFLFQYLNWIKNIVFKGDFGYSFQYNRPVSEVIWSRLGYTFLIALSAHLISVLVGVVVGIYSATHQYSLSDNIATVFAFIGLSIPNFFFAIVIMYLLSFKLNMHVGGLFSSEFVFAPWSLAKLINFLQHFWVPVFVVGIAGTAQNMRIMRGNLLDELQKQYVKTARAKGLTDKVVIYKHAVRNAIQPLVMYLGMSLPFLIQGAIVSSIVLQLPTTGPAFYNALLSQDMYLAGSFLLMLAVTLVIGNLLADVLLAQVDPRVRYD
jgi:peptide/nickel transport system permease protein